MAEPRGSSLPRRGRVAATDLGYTRDRQINVPKSATADLGGGRVGASFVQDLIYRFKHPCKIAVDITIPESKNPKTLICEIVVSTGVALTMSIVIMLSAIKFNDEAMFQAHEIDNVALTW